MMTANSSFLTAPFRLQSPSGLSMELNANGSIRRLDYRDILLNLFLGNELEGGPANLFLRRRGASITSIPLLGPQSPAYFSDEDGRFRAQGEWEGIRFELSLSLVDSAKAWFWHVNLENTTETDQTLDLIYAQDLALAHYWAVRLNEYYVSQYLDDTPLTHAQQGLVLAVRQNQAMGGKHPWVLVGSLGKGVGFATDALQFHGLATRAGDSIAGLACDQLPSRRLQHEHSMAVIQDEAVCLKPGESSRRGFFGWFEEDHPAATSNLDLAFVDRVLALPEAISVFAPTPHGSLLKTTADSIERPVPRSIATLFSEAPLLRSLELGETEMTELFGSKWREVEREDGQLLSFFTDDCRHVVLKAKELKVLRPHGLILRTGQALQPDEASLTSTVWMAGVFNSMLTQGHVNINRFLSTTRSYLSLLRSHGQRLWIEFDEGYHLLDIPSAFEMTPNACRWIYRHEGGLLQVRCEAGITQHQLRLSIEILEGAPCRFLWSQHIALNGDDGADPIPVRFTQDAAGIAVYPAPESELGRRFPQGYFHIAPEPGTLIEAIGGDEKLFIDGQSRHLPWLTLLTGRLSSLGFLMTGGLVNPSIGSDAGNDRLSLGEAGASAAWGSAESDRYWREMTGVLTLAAPSESPLAEDMNGLREILPWFAHNALIHYLAPRGLEQYSGGGWGTRDVCQGPVEMLLALGKWEPLRDLLLRVFKAQNADGDWPQWFMFFERERHIRPGDSHGDIVFWPLLATAEYLLASEDDSLLEEIVPYFHPEGDHYADRTPIWEHIERALAVISTRTIPGTHWTAYGNGDWNDSLQPVDPSMRERLCSTWTVTLHYQMLTALAEALRRLGRMNQAFDCEAKASTIKDDWQRFLLVDGVLTGFAYFHPDGRIDPLVHPRDQSTGLRYSLLPMIHAIIHGLLSPSQVQTHLEMIEQHLLGPDGARLFDRPSEYRGGPQKTFQRAESSSFFGREIGLMYTHAHLRYAEALARLGRAEEFFRALRQSCPIQIQKIIPSATLRQANCYYSSSDAAFADRYQASAEYEQIKAGKIPLEGGWRIYSSGAGIALRLIYQGLLGLYRERSRLLIDPVIPPSLNGMKVEVEWAGYSIRILYCIHGEGCNPSRLVLNGADLLFTRAFNPYREGGAIVSMQELCNRLLKAGNELVIEL
jgi:cellobiose phosphorylase